MKDSLTLIVIVIRKEGVYSARWDDGGVIMTGSREWWV